MEQQKFPIYQVFDQLEQADLSASDLATLRKETAKLAEVVVSQELDFGPEILQTMDRILRSGMPEAQKTLAAWNTALDAADDASRRSMKTMFSGFGRWLEEVDRAARGSFFEVLPELAPSMQQLGVEGMLEILRSVKSLDAPEDRQKLLKCLADYGSTTSKVILGVCSISHKALKWKRVDYLDRLTKTVPAEKMMEDYHAEKLIPAFAQLSEACAERGKELWCQAMELILSIAEEDYSSAYATARKLSLEKIPPDTASAYLENFVKLVKSIGIRVIGFGLKQLPELYKKHGTERTRSFVEGAASAAEAYGAMAGQWFLERRTAAAREIL
jgi:hypothetical protein